MDRMGARSNMPVFENMSLRDGFEFKAKRQPDRLVECVIRLVGNDRRKRDMSWNNSRMISWISVESYFLGFIVQILM
jgi:hypothetical protein